MPPHPRPAWPRSVAEAGPERLAFAGISPAQMLVDSDTDYTAAGLRSQVRSVLSSFGVGDEEQAKQVMTADAPVEIEAAGVPDDRLPVLRGEPARLHHQADPGRRGDRPHGRPIDVRGPGRRRGRGPEDAPLASAPDMNELLVWVVDEDCDILVKALHPHACALAP